MPEDRDETSANFAYFSSEYAQAVDAFAAIEQQAATIIALGTPDDLRTYIDQFVEMADRTRQLAAERREPNFAEWFGELIEKAEAIRASLEGGRPRHHNG
ncbi:MAG TPA: hypothetical protein VM779_16145 [Thermoanaerobaculia bacterium]|nr:hypothetical protein [Thermoanaerobaculia bacterium]